MAVQAGDLANGEKEFSRYIGVRKPEDMPTKWKKDTALALLERATILQAMKQYEVSAKNFQTADEQLVLLDVANDTAGQIGKYIFSDDATQYKAPPSEKLALNAFNIINYLAKGDLSGARVEAKRFTVMREYLQNFKPGEAHGAFGSYLAGFVHERLGEHNQAMRYYNEALQEKPLRSLEAPVRRLAGLTSVRGEHVQRLLGEAPPEPVTPPPTDAGDLGGQPDAGDLSGQPDAGDLSDQPAPELASATAGVLASVPTTAGGAVAMQAALNPQATELLILLNLGRVPYKIPERMPIGLAVGLAGTYITGNLAVLERSALKFVNYPKLVPSGSLFNTGSVSVDGQQVPLELVTNLEVEVVREYEDMLPKIIGSAITRMITRALAAEGARAAGKQAEGSAGAVIGTLAALATEAALVAADKPDTRSWTMLPAYIYVARVPVEPGEHTIEAWLTGPGGKENRKYTVDVAQGGYAVLDITTLR